MSSASNGARKLAAVVTPPPEAGTAPAAATGAAPPARKQRRTPERLCHVLGMLGLAFIVPVIRMACGEEPRGRWALTFGFGLIHGFGFASVLRDLGVGGAGGGIALPLFTFNLGVELGQIVIAAAVLPVVWRLRKNEKFVARGVPALSAAVALAGLYWLLERTVFS